MPKTKKIEFNESQVELVISLMDYYDSEILEMTLEELGIQHFPLNEILTIKNGFDLEGDMLKHLLKLFNK